MLQDQKFKNLSIILPLVLVLIILSFLALRPIALSVFTGLLLSYIFFPVYKQLVKIVKIPTLAALIIVILVLAAVIIPLWFIFPALAKQIIDMYLFIQKVDFVKLIEVVFPSIQGYSQNIATSLSTLFSDLTSGMLSGMSKTILNLPNILLQAAVIFFVFFFGLRDGKEFVEYIKSISPFSEAFEERLIKRFTEVTNSVIYGHIFVGFLQGILTGIGLFIFGIPHAVLFTIAAMLLAIIPFLGAWLVWVPASIYLLISGDSANGIAFLIYGVVVISWIDNIIRPYIVARRTKMSSAVVFVGMIGGLITFGVLGILIGPLVLAYILMILEFYKKNPVNKPLCF